MTNLMPGNPLYPGATIPKDPGAVPSATLGVRWTSDDGRDDLNVVADAINGGRWGYNNLQWFGATYYHKLNDYWHMAFETYNLHQNNVPNATNPVAAAIVAGGGTPFSPQIMPFNAPNLAQCNSPTVLTCTASAQTFLTYVNYSPEQTKQLFFASRMVRRPGGTAHRDQDPLCRRWRELAALVLAADRDASGNRVLPIARRAGIQRQRQCGHRAEPGTMR